MALLDVSDVLADPLFASDFTVYRRRVTVGADGVAVRTETSIAASGVIVPNKGGSISRGPDAARGDGDLTIITTFALTSGSGATEADEVLWKGDRYTVFNTSDFTHFGAGFVEADCALKPVEP